MPAQGDVNVVEHRTCPAETPCVAAESRFPPPWASSCAGCAPPPRETNDSPGANNQRIYEGMGEDTGGDGGGRSRITLSYLGNNLARIVIPFVRKPGSVSHQTLRGYRSTRKSASPEELLNTLNSNTPCKRVNTPQIETQAVRVFWGS